MKIISYPHPTLRHHSKSIKRVDQLLKDIIGEMFDLMYDARGIGLAANQVDLPLRLFIINATGDSDEKEAELVFINPIIDSPKGRSEAEEGCLSLPGVHGFVARPAQIRVSAYDLAGDNVDFVADGLLARAIQHEHDHIEGVLFIDRISESSLRQLESELDEFKVDLETQRANGNISTDAVIAKRIAEIESKYC